MIFVDAGNNEEYPWTFCSPRSQATKPDKKYFSFFCKKWVNSWGIREAVIYVLAEFVR